MLFRVVCLLFLIPAISMGQDTDTLLSIQVKADFIRLDHLGNIYVASGDELIKYDQNGHERARYGNKQYGRLSDVDVRDPMKIMLWYGDLAQVVWLDNFFAVRGTAIALEQSNMDQVSLLAASRDNCFWVFDERERQMLRLNNKLEIVAKSGNLQLLTGRNIVPSKMMEWSDHLYVRDTSGVIIVFDIYASYQRILHVHTGNDFNVIDGKLIYSSHDSLNVYDISSTAEQSHRLPFAGSGYKMLAFNATMVTALYEGWVYGLPIIY